MSTAPLVIDGEDIKQPRAALPARGLVIASIALGLGAWLARSSGGTISWSNLAILAAIAVTALIGAGEARRLVVAQAATESEDAPIEVVGPWLTVNVNPGGPTDAAGITSVPKSPTRDDPERRSLVRRAEERVPAGATRR